MNQPMYGCQACGELPTWAKLSPLGFLALTVLAAGGLWWMVKKLDAMED